MQGERKKSIGGSLGEEWRGFLWVCYGGVGYWEGLVEWSKTRVVKHLPGNWSLWHLIMSKTYAPVCKHRHTDPYANLPTHFSDTDSCCSLVCKSCGLTNLNILGRLVNQETLSLTDGISEDEQLKGRQIESMCQQHDLYWWLLIARSVKSDTGIHSSVSEKQCGIEASTQTLQSKTRRWFH